MGAGVAYLEVLEAVDQQTQGGNGPQADGRVPAARLLRQLLCRTAVVRHDVKLS